MTNCATVNVASLARWCQTRPDDAPFHVVDAAVLNSDDDDADTAPFKYRPDLNEKIIFWEGDVTTLNVAAVTHPTNENFSDHSALSQRIVERAGAQLKDELTTRIKYCRTGEARITQGYGLPARYVIHTVGPKYNVRYRTAAETALYSCYRNVMELVREFRLSDVAIPIIYTIRRGYPPDEGAHLALRTVRRFLEQYGDSIDSVVFVVDALNDGIYQLLAPLYFPRSAAEAESSRYQLPFDIGHPVSGEPVINDRRIRIIDNPQHTFHGALLLLFPSSHSVPSFFCSRLGNSVTTR